jgi:hypothetical protein
LGGWREAKTVALRGEARSLKPTMGMQGHGGMRFLCRFTAVATLAAGLAFAPSLASANPLLSGYGGPGQGSQAILGSALLNGPRGGGGAAGSGTSGSLSSGNPTQAVQGTGAGSQAGSKPARRARAGKPARRSLPGAASVGGTSSSGASAAYRASRSTDAAAPVFGLTSGDLVGAIVVAGVLILVGVLTKRVARRPAPAGRPKDFVRRNRPTG